MYYYKATVQYDGTGYAGFQWQATGATIQDELTKAIQKLVAGKVTTAGASRTDSGVHAVEHVIKITSESVVKFSPADLNQVLPAQIRCLEIGTCVGEFNPNMNSISKEYRYLFTNKTHVIEADRRFVTNVSYQLDFEVMRRCAAMMVGTHDFCNFYSMGSNVRTTIRDVYACELTTIDPRDVFFDSTLFKFPADLTECHQLRIVANGFLKQMIRHTIRALWMVGSGRITEQQFADYLRGPRSQKQLWKVASPNGLFLYKITYPTT
jgi:tRNA pseudouridine38-40 synthase